MRRNAPEVPPGGSAAVAAAPPSRAHVRDLIWEDPGARLTEPLSVAARSLSAAHPRRMGGDAWSIASRHGDMLLLVADARGNGEQAAPLARAVLTVFRSVTKNWSRWDVADIASVLRDTVHRAADEEDFVTALVVHARAEGQLELASCGHPAPLLMGPRGVRELHVAPLLPLGIGNDPLVTTHARLASDERLLLYTDGLTEAPDGSGNFFNVEEHVDALLCDDLEVSLDALLGRLMGHTSGVLHDDLTALLVAGPMPRQGQGAGRTRGAERTAHGAPRLTSSTTRPSPESSPAQPSCPLPRRDT